MKRFYGSTFIRQENFEEVEIEYPIKIEYYKKINDGNKQKYGIEIVQTKYKTNNVNIEAKQINNITNDEIAINNILDIFKRNKVTIINVEDIIVELVKKKFQNI